MQEYIQSKNPATPDATATFVATTGCWLYWNKLCYFKMDILAMFLKPFYGMICMLDKWKISSTTKNKYAMLMSKRISA